MLDAREVAERIVDVTVGLNGNGFWAVDRILPIVIEARREAQLECLRELLKVYLEHDYPRGPILDAITKLEREGGA